MRATQIFLPPYKKGSSVGHSNVTKLLLDGGFIRKVDEGLYAYMPQGMLVLHNIGQLITNELKKLDGQEIRIPVLNPLEIWENSGHYRRAAEDFLVLNDRKGKALVLAPSHEEVMVSVLKEMIREDWQLPAFFFQTQTKIRDEANTSLGLLNPTESLITDGCSLHKSDSDLNNFIPRIHGAFTRLFKLCGLSPLVAEGIVFGKGRNRRFDFLLAQRGGDYRVILCESCDYVADQKVAVGLSKIAYGKLMPLSAGSRSDISRFSDVGKTIGIPSSRVAESRLFSTSDGFVMAVVRADREISREKLAQIVGVPVIGELQDEDIVELGFVPDFLSPLGLDLESMSAQGIRIVVDPAVAETSNIIVAGNAAGSYFVNANFGRDFEGHAVGDISLVDERCRCYHCGGQLRLRHALKLASILRLDQRYSSRLKLSVKDAEGQNLFPYMGSYWFAVDKLMAGIAHSFQDRRGVIWPMQIAPYKSVLIVVGKAASLHRIAGTIHAAMPDLILWDDRPFSFVERLRDADRIGVPIRVIVSARTLRDQTVTLMYRRDATSRSVNISQLKASILGIWGSEQPGIAGEQ